MKKPVILSLIVIILAIVFISGYQLGNKKADKAVINNNTGNIVTDNSAVNKDTKFTTTNINNSGAQDKPKELSKEEFGELKVPKDFKIKNTDLNIFLAILNKDKDLVAKDFPDQIPMYELLRTFVYGDTFTTDYSNFNKCMNGEIEANTLTGQEASICKGENKFVAEEDVNFFKIKNNLTEFKKIVEGKRVSCGYFLTDYYSTNREDKDMSSKTTDYLVCNKLKNKDYNVNEAFYKLNQATYTLLKCDYLSYDKGLQEICEITKPK